MTARLETFPVFGQPRPDSVRGIQNTLDDLQDGIMRVTGIYKEFNLKLQDGIEACQSRIDKDPTLKSHEINLIAAELEMEIRTELASALKAEPNKAARLHKPKGIDQFFKTLTYLSKTLKEYAAAPNFNSSTEISVASSVSSKESPPRKL